MICTGGKNEGVDLESFHTQRAKTIIKLAAAVLDKRFTLVRAPFFSGKTSLGQLLVQHMNKTYPDVWIHYLTLVGMDVSSGWEKAFEKETNLSWKEFIEDSRSPHVLVLDEAQISYSQDSSNYQAIWDLVKRTFSSENNSKCCILFIGAYGGESQTTATPFSFPTTYITSLNPPVDASLPGLLLSEEEFMELIESFERLCFPLDERIRNYIFHITNGHVGFIKKALEQINHQFHNKLGSSTFIQDIYKYVHSGPFFDGLESVRGMPAFEKLTEQGRAICDAVYRKQEVSGFDKNELNTLVKVI